MEQNKKSFPFVSAGGDKLFVAKRNLHQHYDSLQSVLKILNWMGICHKLNLESGITDKKFVRYIYPLFATLTVLDGIIMYSIAAINKQPFIVTIGIAHVILSIISLGTVYALRYKE